MSVFDCTLNICILILIHNLVLRSKVDKTKVYSRQTLSVIQGQKRPPTY